ncbi:S41 family peptidase [Niabella aurantiaca]|uniref:S41 family peptidase n=1 Tax=Niabella aurantiaca TaxID=379900 RepID=UPI00036E86C4|nr:S41 family peptidase [Niabella aurantiaca]
MKLLQLTALFLWIQVTCEAQYLYGRLERKYAPEEMKEDVAQLYGDLKKNHPDLTRFISTGVLQKAFDSLRSGLTDSLTARDLYYRLLPVLSRIGDGHIGINYFEPDRITPEDAAGYALAYHSPFDSLSLCFIGKKIFVRDHRAKHKRIPAGAEIISINSIRSGAIIDSLFRFTFSDGYNTTFKYFFLNYRRPDGLWNHVFRSCKSLHIVYRVKNIPDSITVQGKPAAAAALKQSHPQKMPFLEFKRIDAGTACLKVNTFEPAWDTADQRMFAMVLLKEFSQTSHLILDLRGNNGGRQELMLMLLKSLISKPVRPVTFPEELAAAALPSSADTVRINQQNYIKEYQSLGWEQVGPFNTSYKQRLYVLINGGTFSAAAIMAYALGIDKRAVLIGEETGGGRNSTTAGIMFHNQTKYTGIAYSFGLVPFMATYPSSETGHGVQPDIKISYTVDDYLNNRDLEMERALQLIEVDKRKGE